MKEVVHHGLRVSLWVAENHGEGDFAGNAFPVLIHDYRGHAHLDAGISVGRVQTNNGVASGARQAVGIESSPIDLRVLGQGRAQHSNRIVATVAMASESNAARLITDQDVDAGAVKRSAKSVRMKRLTPLAVRLLVAGTAVLCSGKRSWLKKAFTLHLHISRSEWILNAVMEVVARGHLSVIRFAIRLRPLLSLSLPFRQRLSLRRR